MRKKDIQDENNKRRGRPQRYVTLECFNEFKKEFRHFVTNDFYHLQQRVKLNSKLLWIILGALIALTLIERVLGWATLLKGLFT